MTLFLSGILFLIIGYFVYGRMIERLLRPDDRKTPAYKRHDGVDFVPLPMWKNMLIQLLNIAGVGPVIGVIVGIKFGAKCFWIIPLGCVLMGAVHDYVSGFLSVRARGNSLSLLTYRAFGKWYSQFYTVVIAALLLLVVAVFINIPANLSPSFMPSFGFEKAAFFWVAVVVIFLYYVIATIFPVDKIIGRIYPFFGGLLMLGSIAMLISLVYHVLKNPTLLTETEAFKAGMFQDQPVIPCLFVTIACGIISGFHATQSPIVARTMMDEREARMTYYGMMIVEGLIAMIWAAAAMAIYNLYPALMKGAPVHALVEATTTFLGSWMGKITIVSVFILAITSGDTALRSLRLSIAEMMCVRQKSVFSRIVLMIPLLVIIVGLLWWSNQDATSFDWLWKYFAWGNQILAASTLMVCSVALMQRNIAPWVTLLPGLFMTFVVVSFILWSDPSHPGCPYGLGLPLSVAYAIAGVFVFICAIIVCHIGNSLARRRPKKKTML
jgi:carbon starvation protein CstA